MSTKLLAAVAAVGEGERFNVSALCRDAGIAPKTFYKWVHRYRAEGLEGLAERSRAPHSSPHRTCGDVEDLVVRLRKELCDAGLDHGATTIQWHLRGGVAAGVVVPSVATIHRILVRRGLVVAEPKKRPKSSWKRFEAPAPNEMWQIDAMDWVTDTGVVRVFNIIDDHSRVAIRSKAVLEATTAEAWDTFSQGVARWGLPTRTLSDNGLCFSGKLRGFEVFFESQLRDAGVKPVCGRPFHPQTTGKVERFQQTLKKWLRRQPVAANLTALQDQLDAFCEIYNHQRPHQGIGRVTPISRFEASATTPAPTAALPHPCWPARVHHVVVNTAGVVPAGRFVIGLGVQYEGQPATVQIAGDKANVFINGELIRHLTLDLTARYQPTRTPRGGPRKPRLQS